MNRSVVIAGIIVVSVLCLIIAAVIVGNPPASSSPERQGHPPASSGISQVGTWMTAGQEFFPQYTGTAEFTHTATGKHYLVFAKENAIFAIEIKP